MSTSRTQSREKTILLEGGSRVVVEKKGQALINRLIQEFQIC